MSAASTQARGGEASVAQALEGVPIGQLLGGLAIDLCRAQHDIDLMSIRLTEVMSGRRTLVTGEGTEQVFEERDTRVEFDGERVSLLDLGLVPTFLQMVDTVLEIKLSVSLSRDDSSERRELTAQVELGGEVGAAAHVTAVDARFSSRFQYSAEGSSCLVTRIVPVPAPPELLQVVKGLVDEKGSAPR